MTKCHFTGTTESQEKEQLKRTSETNFLLMAPWSETIGQSMQTKERF